MITIDETAKCAECGMGGATKTGLCMSCLVNAKLGKPMKSPAGQHMQEIYARSAGGRP